MIESSRFGRVEIDPETIVEFPDGLIGVGGSRYALPASEASSPFLWLHSIHDPTLALPVTDPHRFFPEFTFQLGDEDAARLELDDESEVAVYVTVRAVVALEDFRANLKAPILVWSGKGHQVINQAPGKGHQVINQAPGKGHQVINQAPGAELRTPLFASPQCPSGAGAA